MMLSDVVSESDSERATRLGLEEKELEIEESESVISPGRELNDVDWEESESEDSEESDDSGSGDGCDAFCRFTTRRDRVCGGVATVGIRRDSLKAGGHV